MSKSDIPSTYLRDQTLQPYLPLPKKLYVKLFYTNLQATYTFFVNQHLNWSWKFNPVLSACSNDFKIDKE